jgi:hypothetical protein
MSKLREMIEHASAWAEKRFAKTGEIAPIWHAIKADGQDLVLPAPPGLSKDLATVLARAVFEVENVERCVLINEAWTARGIGEEATQRVQAWLDTHNGSIHDYPDRVEVVMFVGEDASEGMITAHREIKRPKNGKPRLGPLQFLEGFSSVQGRIVGMLPRRGAVS